MSVTDIKRIKELERELRKRTKLLKAAYKEIDTYLFVGERYVHFDQVVAEIKEHMGSRWCSSCWPKEKKHVSSELENTIDEILHAYD